MNPKSRFVATISINMLIGFILSACTVMYPRPIFAANNSDLLAKPVKLSQCLTVDSEVKSLVVDQSSDIKVGLVIHGNPDGAVIDRGKNVFISCVPFVVINDAQHYVTPAPKDFDSYLMSCPPQESKSDGSWPPDVSDQPHKYPKMKLVFPKSSHAQWFFNEANRLLSASTKKGSILIEPTPVTLSQGGVRLADLLRSPLNSFFENEELPPFIDEIVRRIVTEFGSQQVTVKFSNFGGAFSPKGGGRAKSIRPLEKSEFTYTLREEKVVVSWPHAWGRPDDHPRCERQKIDDAGAENLQSLVCWFDRVEGAPISFNWGNGWEPIAINSNANTLNLSLDLLRPILLLSPSTLSTADILPDCLFNERGSHTVSSRTYKITQVVYNSGFSSSQAYPMKNKERLPSLGEIVWRAGDPLPSRVTVKIKALSRDGKKYFKDRGEISWALPYHNDKPDYDFHSIIKANAFSSLPIDIPSDISHQHEPNPGRRVPDNDEYRVYVFPDRESCERMEIREENIFSYYDMKTLSQRKVPPYSYGKLIRHGDERQISSCTPARIANDCHSVIFDFRYSKCFGPRKILLISLSIQLDSLGDSIQKGLLKVLDTLKDSAGVPPFLIVTIPSTRESEEFLGCEEFEILLQDNNGIKSIRRRIDNQLRFSKTELHPIIDLNEVGHKYYDPSEIDSVLYIAQSATDPSLFIPPLLGTPMSWNDKDIPFFLLTTDLCRSWEEFAGADECQNLKDIDIERALSQFFRKPSSQQEVPENGK